MSRKIFIMTILLTCVITGCAKASVSNSRRSYILANDHGWIELQIKHEEIEHQYSKEGEPIMPVCHFLLKINNEDFINESIIPTTDDPPYNVDTGFKIPVPTGELHVEILYTGCSGFETLEDDEGNQIEVKKNIMIKKIVEVENKTVTKLFLNGTDLLIRQIIPDKDVSLEEINERLKNIENKLSEPDI